MDRLFHCTDMNTGSIKQMEDIVDNRVATIQEESASATWRHVPSQSNPADLISRGVEPATQEHPHYGGRNHSGLHRSHPVGLQQRSILPQNPWK